MEGKFDRLHYNIVQSSVDFDPDTAQLTAYLELDNNCKTILFANKLSLKINFFEGGFARVQIDDVAWPRFKLDADAGTDFGNLVTDTNFTI